MLNFRKKEKEQTKVKNQDSKIDESAFLYTEENWAQDLNNSHDTFFQENQNQYKNDILNKDNSKFVNNSIFSDYQELNSNTSLLEEENNIEEIKEDKIAKKKLDLTLRQKIHLSIYSVLILFIFSMVIANAAITHIDSNKISADSKTYKVITTEDSYSSVVLPNGEEITINRQEKILNKNNNKFDNFCDKLEGK